MTERMKWMLVLIVSTFALGATTVIGVIAWQQYSARAAEPSQAQTTGADWAVGDRVVFRNTAAGEGYGHIASVPLKQPSGARAVTDFACDRVDATESEFTCLRTVRGISPSYTATLYATAGDELAEWPLTGIPSRTRISADGTRIATTAFVTGHSYATIGFSTETVIRTEAGENLGNLEDWTLLIDGEPSAPVDRNYWGVTFIDDDTFYATVGMTTDGVTYLVKGDLRTSTMQTLAENVECPSLSPSGDRIAFKRVTSGSGATVHWTPAIYDVATGEVALLPESRGIDDQIEWLDDDTILYGLPRDDAPGDSDIWQLEADGSGQPEVFIEHAWSPSIVRSAG